MKLKNEARTLAEETLAKGAQRMQDLSKTSQALQTPGHSEEGHNTPRILVVEAKCDLIDGVGVGHDQVEAILQRKGEEGVLVGKGRPVGLPPANPPSTGWSSAVLFWQMRQKEQAQAAALTW